MHTCRYHDLHAPSSSACLPVSPTCSLIRRSPVVPAIARRALTPRDRDTNQNG